MKKIKLINVGRCVFVFILLFYSYGPSALAQDTMSGQLQIIREAVAFRVKINEPKCQQSVIDSISSLNSIEGFVSYAKEHKITKFDSLLIVWSMSQPYRDSDLDALKNMIVKDLTSGSKAERKTKYKNEFDLLNANVTHIINDKLHFTKPGIPVQPTTDVVHDTSFIKPPDIETLRKESEANRYCIYALAAAIVALFALFFNLRNRFSSIKNSLEDIQKDLKSAKEQLKPLKLTGEISRPILVTNKPSEKKDKANAEKQNETVDDNSSDKNNTLKGKVEGATNMQPMVIEDANAVLTHMYGVKYAKSAINGRFNVIDLRDKQNGEYIYELHIDGSAGKLRLSKDKSVHKYALKDRPEYYFKEDTCIINGTPSVDRSITVLAEGNVTLSSDQNQWIIEKRISLSFDT